MRNYKGPRFWFRYLDLLHMLKDHRLDLDILEIGSGTLELAAELAKDHNVTCIDLSSDLKNIYMELPPEQKKKITCIQGDFMGYDFQKQKYDVVIALEVLEHIEEEELFLNKVKEITRKNSSVYLSVPAHMSLWSKHDEMVGHQRRYEKSDINRFKKIFKDSELLVRAYGWPWINILRLLRIASSSVLYKDAKSLSMEDRSVKSGMRLKKLSILSFLSNKYVLYPFWIFSRLFVMTDLSEGYLVEITRGVCSTEQS